MGVVGGASTYAATALRGNDSAATAASDGYASSSAIAASGRGAAATAALDGWRFELAPTPPGHATTAVPLQVPGLGADAGADASGRAVIACSESLYEDASPMLGVTSSRTAPAVSLAIMDTFLASVGLVAPSDAAAAACAAAWSAGRLAPPPPSPPPRGSVGASPVDAWGPGAGDAGGSGGGYAGSDALSLGGVGGDFATEWAVPGPSALAPSSSPSSAAGHRHPAPDGAPDSSITCWFSPFASSSTLAIAAAAATSRTAHVHVSSLATPQLLAAAVLSPLVDADAHARADGAGGTTGPDARDERSAGRARSASASGGKKSHQGSAAKRRSSATAPSAPAAAAGVLVLSDGMSTYVARPVVGEGGGDVSHLSGAAYAPHGAPLVIPPQRASDTFVRACAAHFAACGRRVVVVSPVTVRKAFVDASPEDASTSVMRLLGPVV